MLVSQTNIDAEISTIEGIIFACIVGGLSMPFLAFVVGVVWFRCGFDDVRRPFHAAVAAFYSAIVLVCVTGAVVTRDLPIEWLVYLVPVGVILGLVGLLCARRKHAR
jgi:hypothetical protein